MPPPVDVPDIPMEEVARRVHAAYGTMGEAWEDIAGSPDANHMTPEQWAKATEGLGLLPEQAEKIYKEMDADGDGKVDFGEFQKAMGVSKDDLMRRMLKKYGNAEEALKACDTDGELSKDEFIKAAMEDMGLSKREAEKIFEQADVDGDGKLTCDEFATAFGAGPEELREAW